MTQVSFNQYQTKATAKYGKILFSTRRWAQYLHREPPFPAARDICPPGLTHIPSTLGCTASGRFLGVTASECQGLAHWQEEDDAVLLELEFKHPNLPEG